MTDQKWLPIESAPRDGTNIDVWVDYRGANPDRSLVWPAERVTEVRWGITANRWVRTFEDGPYAGEDYNVEDLIDEDVRPDCRDKFNRADERIATHWMPPPSPPKAEA